jgi:N-acetyl-gamma-glutamyl-phosphate reductase
MSTKPVIFVDGQEGTTGLKIQEYLAARTDLEVLRIDPDKRKDAAERARCLNAADIAFLCLPDAAAREAVALVTNPATCVIDASTAHRVAPGWSFGLPELGPRQRAALQESKRIANPGCHASGFIVALKPLIAGGLIPADLPVSAFSITGFSGGGKKMIEEYQAGGAHLMGSRPYALGLTHKHLPEMTTHTGLTSAPHFVPIVGPFYNGMLVSIPIMLTSLPAAVKPSQVHQALADYYAREPFVRVMPLQGEGALAAGFLDPQGANGSNRIELFVFGHDTQALVVARLDNLGKGASGAAVQTMNVHLKVDERLGLV